MNLPGNRMQSVTKKREYSKEYSQCIKYSFYANKFGWPFHG